jgi:hypothetical protein
MFRAGQEEEPQENEMEGFELVCALEYAHLGRCAPWVNFLLAENEYDGF